jgi:hypothetical protein
LTLHEPFQITPRLMPGLKVGDGWVSLEFDRATPEGRAQFRWCIDIPAGEFSEADIRSGVGGCTYQQMFGSLLSFLGAAADAYRYEMGGRKSENADLFPPEVNEWAYQHDDEISTLREEIECGAVLIED